MLHVGAVRGWRDEGADVARAMALPVFGGMLVEPFASFIVPTLYCAYLEFKLNAGLRDAPLEQGKTPMLSGPAIA